MKPVSNGTARNRSFSAAGRFRLIQVLEIYILRNLRSCKYVQWQWKLAPHPNHPTAPSILQLQTGSTMTSANYRKMLPETSYHYSFIDSVTASWTTNWPASHLNSSTTNRNWGIEMCLLTQVVGLMPGACGNDKQLRCLRSEVKDYKWQIEISVIDSKWYTRKQCHSPCSIYGIAFFVM
jgi:hypothetical protein